VPQFVHEYWQDEHQLERAGALGRNNGGLLIFAGAGDGAEYVRWRDVVRIDFQMRAIEAGGQSRPPDRSHEPQDVVRAGLPSGLLVRNV
jgi:hypothetical protein